MNVRTSKLLPQGMQKSATTPVAQSGRDADEKKLSNDDKKSLVVAKASSASLPDDIRKALIGELLNAETEVNRFYQGTFSGWTDTNTTTFGGGAVTLSAIPQGTGAGQRLGDSVRLKRLRFRMHIRPGQIVDPGAPFPGPTAGQPQDIEYSYATRLIIGVDKMPVIGTPVYVDANSWAIGATFPTSQAATHANPRAQFNATPAVYPGMMHLSVLNPQTLSRYHILYDRIHGKSDKYEQATILDSGGTAAAIGYYRTSSDWIEVEFNLKGIISQWYDQANDNAILTNKLFFLVVADSPAIGTSKYKWMSEVEFENAP